ASTRLGAAPEPSWTAMWPPDVRVARAPAATTTLVAAASMIAGPSRSSPGVRAASGQTATSVIPVPGTWASRAVGCRAGPGAALRALTVGAGAWTATRARHAT